MTNSDEQGRYTPFANNTTVSMTVEPQFGNVTIAAARNLSKVTNIYGQTQFDLSEYGYQLNPDDVAWNFKGTTTTEGWDVGTFSGHKDAGPSQLFVNVRRIPSGQAPAPVEPEPIIQPFLPEIKLPELPKILPEISEETKKTVLIIGGIIIAAIVLLFAFRPMSPSPAEKVQVRRVRVGEVGVDPVTRRIGAKDVEVAAR